MASRLARTAVGVARRSSLLPRALPAVSSQLSTVRYQSNVPQKDPKKTAQSILDALPGSNLVSKTAILSAGTGISIWAISNEFYVMNEETIVAIALLTVFWAVGKYGGPAYSSWADGQVEKMKGILNSARDNHTQAVKDRIDSVKQLGGVVDITKTLFEVSKAGAIQETAQLEAQAYELEQKTALAHEAKSVLDSWVRYEGQVKQRQQKELADSVIAKIEKELEDPKVLKQILDQSVRDVERIVAAK